MKNRNWFLRYRPAPHIPAAQVFREQGKTPTVGVSAPPSPGDHHHARPRSLARRMSKWAVFILTGGTVVLLAACAFLLFLWLCREDTPAWKRILISAWATRAVTLTSLVIRTAAGAQAAVCTAMLASLALEGGEAALSRAAGLSGIRYSNSGPLDIVLELVRGRGSHGVVLALSLLLLLTTVLSQFMSTMLLSDFRDMPVHGYSTSRHVAYGAPDSPLTINDGASTDYFKSRPPFYAAFAEYREPPPVSKILHGTGITLRGFLPFPDSQTRSAISKYVGKATVMDVTVTCERPNVSFDIDFSGEPGLLLKGRIGNQTDVVEAASGGAEFIAAAAIPAAAVSPRDIIQPHLDWATTITALDGYAGLQSYFARVHDDNTADIRDIGQIFIVVNTTGAGWQSAKNETWLNGPHSEQSKWEWKHFFYRPIYPDRALDDKDIPINPKEELQISISLCYIATGHADVDVRVYGNKERKEPSLTWDNTSGIFDTSTIRAQLEIGSNTIAFRDRSGFMTLAPKKGKWPSKSGETGYNETYPILDRILLSDPNSSYLLCSYCGREFAGLPIKYPLPGEFSLRTYHPANIALFQDTLRASSHPAFALQALITTAASSRYYDQIVLFSVTTTAELLLYETVLGPGLRFVGLSLTLAILASHALLTAVVTVLFSLRSKWSLLGNSWQAVVQAAAIADQHCARDREVDAGGMEALALKTALLERASTSTDEEVLDNLVAVGYSGRTRVILDAAAGGKVCIRLRDGKINSHGLGS